MAQSRHTGKEVITMDAKERILTILLMEKLRENPEWVKTLGVVVNERMSGDGAVQKP